MKNLKLLAISTISLFFLSCVAKADHNLYRPDAHAPIGVMRDHVHEKGEVMLSYRYEFMKMQGMRDGENGISSSEVLTKNMMSPTSMDMKMHMFGAMYGLTDKFTIMAMASLIEKDMNMINRSGALSQMDSSGFGDVKLNGMYEFFKNQEGHAQFNLGASLPTGNIKERGQGRRLPYTMQIGSGSYELLPGISFSGFKNSFSYGAQINGIFRLDNNSNGYKLGNSYNFTSWVAKKLNQGFSISSRLDYTINEGIEGVDSSLNKAMSPANNSFASGGRRLDFLVGGNFIMPNGYLQNHRLALEFGTPIYQNLRYRQLETDYKVTLGWQKVF